MKWISHVCAWVLLVGLIAFAPMLQSELPSSSEGMATDGYKQWAGVLRVWVNLEWKPGSGSLIPWLNGVCARFERAHPGVYVQVTPVSGDQLADYQRGDANPPDALIFSPGVIADSGGLMAIDGEFALNESLAVCGAVDGELRAVPIAMGGYAWAVNTQLLDGLPLRDIELPAPSKKDEPTYIIQAPADTAGKSWSGALLALCMAMPLESESGYEGTPVGDGIDLGLSPMPEETPQPEQARSAVGAVFTMPDRLPPNFRMDGAVVGDFAAKRAAAIPVTQAEIKQLENLADTGRVPDYGIMPGLGSYTDQLALFAITRARDDQAAARRALCRALLDALLEDRAQQDLSTVRALRVTDGAPIYATNRGMAALESGYNGRQIETPGAFEADYIAKKQAELDRALGG